MDLQAGFQKIILEQEVMVAFFLGRSVLLILEQVKNGLRAQSAVMQQMGRLEISAQAVILRKKTMQKNPASQCVIKTAYLLNASFTFSAKNIFIKD